MFGACDRTAKRLFEGAKQALGWTSAADVPQPDSRASLSEAARPFAKEFDKKAMVWELNTSKWRCRARAWHALTTQTGMGLPSG